MSRTRTLLAALAAAATAAVLLAQPSVANACGGGDGGQAPPEMDLTFATRSWYTGDNPDTLGIRVRAPRAFEMTKTPTGQGRFNDATRTWLLTVDPMHQEAHVADLMHAREHELAGLRDLEIVRDGVTIDSENQRLATVIYRYTNAAGEARLVQTRYVASMPHKSARNFAFAEITVAGPPRARAGLNAIMRIATQSIYFAG